MEIRYIHKQGNTVIFKAVPWEFDLIVRGTIQGTIRDLTDEEWLELRDKEPLDIMFQVTEDLNTVTKSYPILYVHPFSILTLALKYLFPGIPWQEVPENRVVISWEYKESEMPKV